MLYIERRMFMKKKKLSLPVLIMIGMVLGILGGIPFQKNPEFAVTYIKPFGTLFLNLIKMIVVPVVLCSIISGVISMKDIRKVGSVGLKSVSFYLVTTAVAVSLGAQDLTFEAVETPSLMDTLLNIFPSNAVEPLVTATMLQVIVLALFFGFGIILAGEKGEPLGRLVDSMTEVCLKIMGMIIQLSPIGVFALLLPVVAENGPSVLLPLLKLILVIYAGYLFHMLIVFSITSKSMAHISPKRFFKEMMPAMTMAFSSSSSVGTLPLNIECSQKLGAKKEITSFVLPLGATINMNGTSIYQGVCAIFIANVFGIDLSITQQIMIVVTATLASVGTAGVPGSGVIMLSMVLQSAGLPLEGIALIAGIDRILDMGRTVVNITGDANCAVCISAMEDRKAERRAAKLSAEEVLAE